MGVDDAKTTVSLPQHCEIARKFVNVHYFDRGACGITCVEVHARSSFLCICACAKHLVHENGSIGLLVLFVLSLLLRPSLLSFPIFGLVSMC